jgi:hypothetical protein
MAKTLCYKPEKVSGSSLDDVTECFWIYLILPAALGPGLYSASNRNEYQKQTNNVSGCKTRPARTADNPTAICK